jgi:hypothetical protein
LESSGCVTGRDPVTLVVIRLESMIRFLSPLLFASLLCLVSGCFSSYPTCGYAYRNDSESLIWVDQVIGLGPGPTTCGALAPSEGDQNAVAGIRGIKSRSELPDTVEITWWIGKERPTNPVEILNADVTLPKELPRNHQILFVYSADGNWTATLEKL